MPFNENESSPRPFIPSDSRPETYKQYKEEAGADLKTTEWLKDVAAYFNGDMHTLVLSTDQLKFEIKESISLTPEEKAKMLRRLDKMEVKLEEIRLVVKDALHAFWKKEQGQ